MGPPPPSRLFLALTLFFTLTHATVTVYTPTQVVFTTAPATSGTPASPNRSSSRPTLRISRGRPSRYSRGNCAAMFSGPGANVTNPQSVLLLYLTHDAHTELLAPYLNSTMDVLLSFPAAIWIDGDSAPPTSSAMNSASRARGARQSAPSACPAWACLARSCCSPRPFPSFLGHFSLTLRVASCGGFLGISDSFTAVLGGLDYALQMAHSNFSGAMFHLGGQNVFIMSLVCWASALGRCARARAFFPPTVLSSLAVLCLPSAVASLRLTLEQKRRDALTGCALVVLPRGVRARGSLFLSFGRSLCHETLFTVFYGNKASDHDLAGTSKPPSAAVAEASFIAAGLVVATVAVLARAL
ncbi:hypothetical protein B0H16DRAFT_1903575 [Mycena metata]|uniref:Uncharacterized protein n=1 Tax=Mycena metata TaxID=1033252 RepID=A0AAD7DRR5_9AGAR|nr:hypothetical protein B0H16DRAFT_1903575 [Mycena metata]